MHTIFIIAPHFPPSAMPPSQRVRLYVQHLRKLGFQPVVFTVDHYYREEIADTWMNELAGKDFDVVQVKCLDQRITRKFGLGDQGLRMLPFLYSALIKEVKKRKPDFILYPVPPWYIMWVAPFVKKATGVKFGIDFIDPWVHDSAKAGFKAKMSQLIARKTEGWVLKHADLLVAVSQSILSDIVKRYSLDKTPTLSLPYGVEPTDYQNNHFSWKHREHVAIRYIGAISDAMLPVAEVLIAALKQVSTHEKIEVDFVGTSYARQGAAEPNLTKLISNVNASNFINEKPDRVSYRQAVQLTADADLLLLIGDTTHYYAASKLMGLAASGKPFVAFVHEKSFPAFFLAQHNYGYYLTYGDDCSSMHKKKDALETIIRKAIAEKDRFAGFDTSHASFEEHTAFGMTKKLTQAINTVLHAS